MSSQHHTHVTCWWHVQSNLQYQVLIPKSGGRVVSCFLGTFSCAGEKGLLHVSFVSAPALASHKANVSLLGPHGSCQLSPSTVSSG